jgi:hypothetical protein
VRNVSTHHVGRFHCGQPLLAVLVDESGQVLGGNAPAAIAGTGRSIDLNRYDSPGQEFATTALQRPQPRAPWPSVRAWTADQSDDRVSVRSAETAREARPTTTAVQSPRAAFHTAAPKAPSISTTVICSRRRAIATLPCCQTPWARACRGTSPHPRHAPGPRAWSRCTGRRRKRLSSVRAGAAV